MFNYHLLSEKEEAKIQEVYAHINSGLKYIFLSMIPLFLGIFYTLLLVLMPPYRIGKTMLVGAILMGAILIKMLFMAKSATTTLQSKEWEAMLKKIDQAGQSPSNFSGREGQEEMAKLSTSRAYRLINPGAEANSFNEPFQEEELESARYLYDMRAVYLLHLEDIAGRVGMALDEGKDRRKRLVLLSIVIVSLAFITDIL